MNSQQLTLLNWKIGNTTLKNLPEAEFKRILPFLEKLEFALGEVIYLPSEKIEYVYFPENLVGSVVTTLEDGSTIETGIIGNEGIIGFETILNESTARREVNIQLAGNGFRMKTEIFQLFFAENTAFRKNVLTFIGSFLSQISQNAACLSFHNIEQRLSRWLMMFQNRALSNELKLTQEFIALMLGVHRPSVSKNANKLQQKGLIRYNRGKITICDLKGLENNACECYTNMKVLQNEPAAV